MDLLKLGYSANPQKRQRHQLGLPKTAQVTLLRNIAMPTGHAACAAEKRLHARLRRQHPEAVVPPQDYRGILNVVSEVWPGRSRPSSAASPSTRPAMPSPPRGSRAAASRRSMSAWRAAMSPSGIRLPC
ncbi:hypothetical protein [Paracoccus sp. 22332]|uniref:hypothetical protein n=1 Tax=Paracoccus sp. 22332 TaxID=3453913 RepID=UPI003F877AF9